MRWDIKYANNIDQLAVLKGVS